MEKMKKIRSSEITPEHVYLSRRRFMKGAGLLAASAVLAACGQRPAETPVTTAMPSSTSTPASTPEGESVAMPTATEELLRDELGTPATPFQAVRSYNNFYEFSLFKDEVAELAQNLTTAGWKVEVGGLVNNPKTFDLDDVRAFGEEERIYRLRCVEAWSMVIPWLGFPLSKLLKEVDPLSSAKYVRFETLVNPEEMVGQKDQSFPWPYVEGLRLDEAMHDLTLMATGLYGRKLPNQNGAPLRLVVPWKYGFKSIKSIVKIELVEEMPKSLWMVTNSAEYGFWANVNPEVPHPRWSQATERRIGDNKRVETLFMNGYADEVADLYPDLDRRDWYR